MTIEELLEKAKMLWADKPMTLQEIAVVIGVVYGDICRQSRNQTEGKMVDEAELQKELGNLIFSCIRWCAELGYEPKKCIALAEEAQARYVASLPKS
jgi:hypothetical protein